jgi:hypothetical protein
MTDHRFQNLGDGQARKVGNHSRGGKREAEQDQVMGGLPNTV